MRVDENVLRDPVQTARMLYMHWLTRTPVVVDLAVAVEALKEPERWNGDVYDLGPDFELARERLHFVVWANNYDAHRGGAPIWWHGWLAERLGARPADDDDGDVRLPDGTPAWCDGGPREPLELSLWHRETIELGRLPSARPLGARRLELAGDQQAGQLGRLPLASWRQELAADQQAAVWHTSGAARVIAPAGSGKTRVLTERLRHLIVERGVEADIVTALAYNRRAAEEMRQRLRDLTRDVSPRVQTLHALGYALLNGVRPRRLLDEKSQRDVLWKLVPVKPQQNQDPLAPYLEALTEVRTALRAPVEVEKLRGDVPGFAAAFARYRAILRDRDWLDFDEQIYGAVELLLADAAIRKRAQRACRHLLVDEFQDLTPAHLLMVRLLAGPAGQVFGVGDDDQVIYGYAGADPKFLIEYDTYFFGAQKYALSINYRCPPGVVEAASSLLGRNRRRVPKQMCAYRTEGVPVTIETPREEELAATALTWLRRWGEAGVEPRDMAVLTRVNSALLSIQMLCLEARLPVVTGVSEELLARTGIRAVLAWLRLGQNPQAMARDDVAEALRRPTRMLKRHVLEHIQRRATWSYRQLQTLPGLEEWEADRLDEFMADVNLVSAAVRKMPCAGVLRLLRDQVGLGTVAQSLDASRLDRGAASHLDDLNALVAVAAVHADVATFEAWLRERLAVQTKQGIMLSTVHRVKGMEWRRVIVLDVSEGAMPHRLASDVEEERRVFHVALTRCLEQAVVVANAARPSRFVREMAGAGAGERPQREKAGERGRVGVRPSVSVGQMPGPGMDERRAERPARKKKRRRGGGH